MAPALTGSVPAARESAGIVALEDGRILIFGGGMTRDADEGEEPVAEQFNDVYVLDTLKNTWERVEGSGAAPSARTGHTMVKHGSSVYVFGGCSASDGYLNDLHILDLKTWTWGEPVTVGAPPSARDK
ncbi:hypothetical protein CYMTET_25027, partial [Cymbomonas tetramitiformis]